MERLEKTYSLEVHRCGLTDSNNRQHLMQFQKTLWSKEGKSSPAIVVVAVDVEDLLALDGEHSVTRSIVVSPSPPRRLLGVVFTQRECTP